MPIHVDTSAFPFVLQQFPAEQPTDAEVMALIEEGRRILARKERFVMLVDASKQRSTLPTQRKMYADWLKEAEPQMRRYCVGTALVLTNAVMRGALQALMWLITPPSPLEAFATTAEAARRCHEWMRAAGLRNAEAAQRLVA